MSPEEISQAAFWDQLICLDCDQVIPPDDPVVQAENCCPHCGSDAVHSAVFIQRVIEWAKSGWPF